MSQILTVLDPVKAKVRVAVSVQEAPASRYTEKTDRQDEMIKISKFFRLKTHCVVPCFGRISLALRIPNLSKNNKIWA